MLYPSINDLLKDVDSRYTLVLLVSKRARQIVDGAEPLVNPMSSKPVSIALQEVAEGKFTYTRSNTNK
ncbi:DNA-directed RNA polymerase subunit omega [Proteiniborus ethanoligenes]|uniref:DNA-directed RNA polymerase subunit omega n=1 Tax=Proteiniborus ethanoligenes TaxID=415015 RepID=A0A1H3PKH1_9FIRM|nr:DNA-directed RNA polymerase subunit omega [Proteiniborus ethanoligenes]SDZ01540.1 DNA-directed RNA polymerase subunit omega [Proteiniborus ethanoligenes]